MRALSYALLIPCLLVATPGFAGDESSSGGMLDGLLGPSPGIGAGLYLSSSVYDGKDATVLPLPFASSNVDAVYSPFRWFIRDGVVGFRVARSANLEFSLVGKLQVYGYESGDSDALRGMEDRDWSVDLGVLGAWQTEGVRLEALAFTDALDKSGGQEYQLSLQFPRHSGRLIFVPHVDLLYFSDKLVDYYFGVRPEEATAVRPAYRGDGGTALRLSVRSTYQLNKRWTLHASAHYTALPSEVTDSPIVDSDGALSLFLGGTYRF